MNSILDGWSVPARPAHLRPPGAGVTQLELCGAISVEGAIPLFHAVEAARGDSLEITIDSPGGNALCALALYELLVLHPHRVVADITRASSGAALVALGADFRRIAPGGRILLHETKADLRDVPAAVVREILADLEKFDSIAAEIVAAATNQQSDRVAAWRRSTTMFSAHEAIGVGIAHELT